MLASNLITLHLLAPENDKLIELLPHAAEGLASALSAADRARQLQLQPLFNASAAAAGQTLGSFGSSSSSSGVGGSQAATSNGNAPNPSCCSSSSSGNAPNASSSSSSSAAGSPSLYHLAMQHSCYSSCPPQYILPWLQLLGTLHALHIPQTDNDIAQKWKLKRITQVIRDPASGEVLLGSNGDTATALDVFSEPEAGLAAAAVALRSFADINGISNMMPNVLSLLGGCAQRELVSKVLLLPLGLQLELPAVTPSLQQLRSALQQQQQQQQQQQPSAGVKQPPSGSQQQQQQRMGESTMEASPQQQQQQLGSAECCFVLRDPLAACVYWMHGERLLAVPPEQWPKLMATAAADATAAAAAAAAHAAAHSSGKAKRSSSSGGGGTGQGVQAASAAAAAAAAAVPGGCDVQSLQLLADLNCDWCNRPMQHNNSSSANDVGAQQQQQQQQRWGCASCSNAQYCSHTCAAAGNKVHGPNCW
jgi:hypothetical protein